VGVQGGCQSARGFDQPPRRRPVVGASLLRARLLWLSRGMASGLTSSTRSIGLVPGVRGDVGLGRRPGRCGGRGEGGGEFGGRLRATGRLKGRPAVVCAPSLLVPSRASPQRPPRSAPTSPSANVRTALLLNLLENSWLVLAAVVGAAQRWDLHLGEGRGVRRPRRHGVDCRARARVLHGPSTRWHRFSNC